MFSSLSPSSWLIVGGTESGQNRKEVMSAEVRSFLVFRIGQQVNETIIEDGSYVKGKNSEW